MKTDKRVSHLRSWRSPQGSTAGVTSLKGSNGSPVYRLDVALTDAAADSRENLMAELSAQRAARLKS